MKRPLLHGNRLGVCICRYETEAYQTRPKFGMGIVFPDWGLTFTYFSAYVLNIPDWGEICSYFSAYVAYVWNVPDWGF